jgi:hypothetical protein
MVSVMLAGLISVANRVRLRTASAKAGRPKQENRQQLLSVFMTRRRRIEWQSRCRELGFVVPGFRFAPSRLLNTDRTAGRVWGAGAGQPLQTQRIKI